MKIDKWNLRGIHLAKLVSGWSKDPSTQVGAAIFDQKNRVLSVGYNGYPRGIKDIGLENREEKYLKVLHAEQNAILFAHKNLIGSSIYVYPFPPCSRCAGVIIQSGISSIYTIEPTEELLERWEQDLKIAFSMYQEAGISFCQYDRSLFEEKN